MDRKRETTLMDMKNRPKINQELREAMRKLIIMERGLLSCYELAEMGRKKVEAQREKVRELRDGAG